jgi:hypothetical protein
MMPRWEVRVTRDLENEYADTEVEAPDWEEAKRLAVEEAKEWPEKYFGPVAPPEYDVRQIDDDAEAGLMGPDDG